MRLCDQEKYSKETIQDSPQTLQPTKEKDSSKLRDKAESKNPDTMNHSSDSHLASPKEKS